jgi:hypothetical protein
MHEHEEKPKHPHDDKCEPKEPVVTTQADDDDNGTDPRNNGGHNG